MIISTSAPSHDRHPSLLDAFAPQKIETLHVSILMCTYNGGRYLSEQLRSIEQQTHTRWTLFVSDDGSQDNTSEVLQEFGKRETAERLKVINGPRKGFVTNFLSLTADADIQAPFYAWSDQDDIWHANKLETALTWLNTIPDHIPALYCGRCELIDESGAVIGFSPLFNRPPRFSNALVQSISGGNTMVFNHAARRLLQEAGGNLAVASHDWWAYQLISGAGGIIHYDPIPKVSYRQHSENVVGSNSGWCARIKRVRMVFQGRFGNWNAQNIHALEAMHHHLTQKSKATLAHFKAARHQTLFYRFSSVWRAGLYRQTLAGNLGLVLATLFKKI